MIRGFAITTSAPSMRLRGGGQGEFTFTVTNALGRPVRARALLRSQESVFESQVKLVGEAEREFTADGTHQFTVRVTVPPGTAEATHSFSLSLASLENPDEEFAESPQVSVQVTAAAASRRIPGWVLAVAAGVAVLLLATLLVVNGRHSDQQGIGGSGAPPPLVYQSFDGRSTYIELGNPRALDFTGLVTLEAWIRPRTLEGLRDIVAHGYTTHPDAELYLRIDNGHYQVGSWGPQDSGASAPAPATDVGQWVHLAGVYDGSRWILYRNGEVLASNPGAPGAVSVPGPWAIGARGGGTERFFLGDIRDVRIWNLPRTQQELRGGMSQLPAGIALGLMGDWPMNEGQGSLAEDVTSNGNDGLIRQGTWGSR